MHYVVSKQQTEIADSFPINELMESNPLFTRREMLGVASMAGVTALAGMTPLAGSAAYPQMTIAMQKLGCNDQRIRKTLA
jgi:hypothetical protein